MYPDVLTVPAIERVVAGISVLVISKHTSPCRVSRRRYKCVMPNTRVNVSEYVRVVVVDVVRVGLASEYCTSPLGTLEESRYRNLQNTFVND